MSVLHIWTKDDPGLFICPLVVYFFTVGWPISSLACWCQTQNLTPEILLNIVQISRFSAIRACLLFISQEAVASICSHRSVSPGHKDPRHGCPSELSDPERPHAAAPRHPAPLALRSSLALLSWAAAREPLERLHCEETPRASLSSKCPIRCVCYLLPPCGHTLFLLLISP